MSGVAFVAASQPKIAQLDRLTTPAASLRGAQPALSSQPEAAASPASGLFAASASIGAAAALATRSTIRRRKTKIARGDVQDQKLAHISEVPSPLCEDWTATEAHLRRPMELFLDTADEEEWEKLLSLGIFYGVTTNPMILQRSNQPCTLDNCQRLLRKALSYPGVERMFFQVWGETAENYEKIGLQLWALDPEHVGVKLPLTDAGIRAASFLKRKGVRICMTGCMSAKQVLTANALHADYISPYLGKMCDSGMDGMHEVEQMYDALKDTPGRTRVFAASIRNVGQMMQLAAKGLDSFTFPVKVAHELVEVQATDEATETFEKCAKDMWASTCNPYWGRI